MEVTDNHIGHDLRKRHCQPAPSAYYQSATSI